eukprot:CAMPEP_0171248434 /NCGR_PEP_ID=MMETSP0790-20130122/49019_1 /TAXON_ID=2925 /ORGANISM="Alexandrium catenella, Strain OF101" /LENGTH=239 /DNA_ID=CAMNT_0011715895 /DNA_START=61 /DNA_END=776 /DNA_ORIENTATION=+
MRYTKVAKSNAIALADEPQCQGYSPPLCRSNLVHHAVRAKNCTAVLFGEELHHALVVREAQRDGPSFGFRVQPKVAPLTLRPLGVQVVDHREDPAVTVAVVDMRHVLSMRRVACQHWSATPLKAEVHWGPLQHSAEQVEKALQRVHELVQRRDVVAAPLRAGVEEHLPVSTEAEIIPFDLPWRHLAFQAIGLVLHSLQDISSNAQLIDARPTLQHKTPGELNELLRHCWQERRRQGHVR